MGQTFCVRAMITAFMGDASNIMSFYGEVDNSVGYAVELWIFKPQESGQQVSCDFLLYLIIILKSLGW